MAIIDNFSKEELEQIVQESKSYREVLAKLGYATAGGNNNKTLKKVLIHFDYYSKYIFYHLLVFVFLFQLHLY